MDARKALDRVKKLLRTAAPESGASDTERQLAAREAGLIIAEFGFAVEPAETSKRPKTVSPHAWVLTESINYAGCSNCGGTISPRDVVWLRVLPGLSKEFRHNTDRCRVRGE